ncbi:MAG: hypothetical protein GY797_36130 [Deltaproteobacteria bacterium]|nr:hypothetical protein [Deltaproteobacteria bacterium]
MKQGIRLTGNLEGLCIFFRDMGELAIDRLYRTETQSGGLPKSILRCNDSPWILCRNHHLSTGKRIFNISILEGSWAGDRTERAFKVCGYFDIGGCPGKPSIIADYLKTIGNAQR